MKFFQFSAIAASLFSIIDIVKADDGMYAHNQDQYQRELIQENGLPTTFCEEGKKHIVNKKPHAKIYTCPQCTIWNWPNARDWLAAEAFMYGFEIIERQAKTEPYIVFYNINTVACLDKDADVSSIKSANDLKEGTETFEQHQEWFVDRNMAMAQDLFRFGENGSGPKEMNALV